MDAITGFLDEYLSTFDPRDIAKPQNWDRNFFGVPNFHRKVMYKEGQFQVECLNWPPGTIIPEHVHPDIDSYEVYIRDSGKTIREKKDHMSLKRTQAVDK